MEGRLQPAAVLDVAAFEVVAVLKGTDRIAFLKHYFWRVPTAITRAHHICSAVILAAAVLSGSSLGLGLAAWGVTAAAGLAFTVVLVTPVHEALHAGAYKVLGAKDIRWTVSVSSQIASVTAHRFVLSHREVMFVAALPWLALTTIGILAVALLPAWRLFCLITLLVHHVGSRGDWAYLSYFWRCRGRDVYVVEDADLQQSLFYVARQR